MSYHNTNVIFFIIFTSIILIINASLIKVTKQTFTGNMSYTTFGNICGNNDYTGCQPEQIAFYLQGGSLGLQDFKYGWLLTLGNNCQGYTTNNQTITGTCLFKSSNDVYMSKQCTCDMKIPLICCL